MLGIVEFSVKGVFLMVNWREVLLRFFGVEKRVFFYISNVIDFFFWRE